MSVEVGCLCLHGGVSENLNDDWGKITAELGCAARFATIYATEERNSLGYVAQINSLYYGKVGS